MRHILAELHNPFYTLINKVCKLPDAAPLQQLLYHQSYLCARPSCLASLYDQPYHLNHIVPVRRGGMFSPNDFEWLCPRCFATADAYRPSIKAMQDMV